MKPLAPGLMLLISLALVPVPATADGAALGRVLDDAAALEPLETVLIWRDGEPLAGRGYRDHAIDAPTNIKSASKAIVAAFTGIAINRGHLEGVAQPVAPLVENLLPAPPDPRVNRITIGHLLSMQAGLARTSGRYYGRWFMRSIAGRDVAYAWGFGGQMLYVVPGLETTVVMTSNHTVPSGGSGHRDDLHRLLADILRAVACPNATTSRHCPRGDRSLPCGVRTPATRYAGAQGLRDRPGK